MNGHSNKTLLLHVGLPKTGTTTLQVGLFEECNHLEFMGKFTRKKHEGALFGASCVNEFRKLLNYGNEFCVTESAPLLARQIVETVENSDKDKVLVSLEGITNPFVDTDYAYPKDVFLKARHLKEVITHVENRDIDIKILITIRRQSDILPSLFAQVYLQGFSSALYENSYDSFLDFMLDDDVGGFGAMFKYDALIGNYQSLFGKENVYIAQMEKLFVGEYTEAVRNVSDFLSIPEEECLSNIGRKRANARKRMNGRSRRWKMMDYSSASRNLEKQFNTSFHRAAFGLRGQVRRWLKKPIYWELEDYSDRINRYYKKSNERLFNLCNIKY